jgi:hypothetical protein
MNALSEIDFAFDPETSSIGFPADLLNIMSGLVMADEPFFTAAEEKVLADLGSSSVRGQYHEVVSVRSADRKFAPVPSARILARFAKALPEAEFDRHSKRHSSHVNLDLYGYVHRSGLAVVQVRSGTWDAKYGFGTMSKEYFVVDTFGNAIAVAHGKLRGAARTHPFEVARPLVAALRDIRGAVNANTSEPVRLRPARQAV